MAGHGTFSWNELMTRNVEAAKAFYAQSLGWRFDAWPMEDGSTYWIAMAEDKPAAGLMDMSAPVFEGMAAHWFAYIEVDDVDACVAKAASLGAQIRRPPFDIPKVGRIAIVEDPTGAVAGWMTPAPQDG